MTLRWPACLGALWITLVVARADDWVLTGLSRLEGSVRVYLMTSPGGSFVTLQPGEERLGWRLVEVSFRERCVWLADTTRTTRVTFASAPTVPTAAVPGRAEDAPNQGSSQKAARKAASLDDARAVREEVSSDEAMVGNQAMQVGTGTGQKEEPAIAADSAKTGGEKPSGPWRRATADELFKARQGYGAWENLLRQRRMAQRVDLNQTAP